MSEPNLPTPEQLQQRLQEFLRASFSAPAPIKPPPQNRRGAGAKGITLSSSLSSLPGKSNVTWTALSSSRTKPRRLSASPFAIIIITRSTCATLPPEEANKVEYAKQNVVLIGPTGVGKTYLVKHIADLVGVPFVKADATKFSETGYVGGDVEDLVRELVHKADGDIALAQYGIIYIDEIDKIASSARDDRTRRERPRRANRLAQAHGGNRSAAQRRQ